MKTDIKFLKSGMKKEPPVEEKNTLISEIPKTKKQRKKTPTLQFILLNFFVSERISSKFKTTSLNLQ